MIARDGVRTLHKPFELDSFLDMVAGLLTERRSEGCLAEAV